MTDILRTMIQRLQVEPLRERALPAANIRGAAISHEQRSVEAVRQRMQVQNTDEGMADIAGVAFHGPHDLPPEQSDRNLFLAAPAESTESVNDVSDVSPGIVEPDELEVDRQEDDSSNVGLGNVEVRNVHTTEASSSDNASAFRSTPRGSHSIQGSDEQLNSPSGSAINVADIVEMVRDELRPLLDDLGARMTRTIRSEGNSRQFRLRANQVD